MRQATLSGSESTLIGDIHLGTRRPVKPIAPFEKDGPKAAATVFDRETGKPVDPEILRTYAEALAQYHISPEAKFLNGDIPDKGTTHRRHIVVTHIQHIGKEADDWERGGRRWDRPTKCRLITVCRMPIACGLKMLAGRAKPKKP